MVSASSKRPADKPETGVPVVTRYKLLVIAATISVVVDQVTKYWAVKHLRPIGNKQILRGYLDFHFSLNQGAAWSFLADAHPTFRRWFFLTTTLGALALIGTLYHRARMDQGLLRWALALLFGGAVGNLIDRVLAGQVVDFIALRFINWPTFNVADIAIVAGLILLLFDLLKTRKKDQQVEGAPAAAQESRPGQQRRKRVRR